MNPSPAGLPWKHKLWPLYRLLARLRFLLATEATYVSPFDERYHVNPYSYVERAIQEGKFETERAAYLRRQLMPADVFIDIGANIGFFTMIAARKGTSVYAFEPDPRNHRRLLRNVQLNGFSEAQVKVHACALSDEAGHAVLHRPLNDNYGMASLVANFAPDGVRVPLQRLDDVLKPPATRCMIKVDVEGAELQVLAGAEFFRQNVSPGSLWLIEVHTTEGVDVAAVAALFPNPGYRLSYFNDKTGEITSQKHAEGDILLLAERIS